MCPICLKKDIEDSVTCGPNDSRSKLSLSDFMKQNINSFNDMTIKPETNLNLNLFSYNKGFIKMKIIDNYNKAKRNMFYYDSAYSCRDKYRKKVFDDY